MHDVKENCELPNNVLQLNGKDLEPHHIFAITRGETIPIAIDPIAMGNAEKAHQIYTAKTKDRRIYGGNSGLGSRKDIALNEENNNTDVTIAATATTTNALGYLPPEISKAMLAIQINSFLSGGIGAVRPQLINKLVDVFNTTDAKDFPSVPAIGNGHGDLNSAAIFAKWWMNKNKDFTLEPGEDLALIAGNYYPEAISAVFASNVERLMDIGYAVFAITSYAFDSQTEAVDLRVADARPLPKMTETIERINKPLEQKKQLRRGRNLQDPISFRSFPQVAATIENQLDQLLEFLHIEINSATQNPYSDKNKGDVIHNANFDTTQHSVILSSLQLGLAKYADISFKRLSKLCDPHFNGAIDGFGNNEKPKSGVQSLNLTNIAGQVLQKIVRDSQSNLTDSFSISFQNSIEDSVSGLFQQSLYASRLIDDVSVVMTCELIAGIAGIRYKIDNGILTKDALPEQLVTIYDALSPMINTSGTATNPLDIDSIRECFNNKTLFPTRL
ncbi:MAG TPA: aromatic amino acid lyase [Patescibacteria group bacterium]|nr:aromatic amino acid lyase [Patescibacteria group bacterium]